MDLWCCRDIVNKLKAHTSATNVKNFEIPYRSQSTSSYSVAGFFFSVFHVGTWKQLPYLFASHIMESIHFLRFKRKAGEKKGQKRHKLTLSHAHAHLTILKMHGLSLFFAIRFAVIECDFSSAKWYSSLLRAHLLNAVGFWLHILFAKWFTIWFIISIYFLLARTHTETLETRWNQTSTTKNIAHKKTYAWLSIVSNALYYNAIFHFTSLTIE